MDSVKIFFDLLGRTSGERDISAFGKTVGKAGDEGTKSAKKFQTLAEGTKKLSSQMAEAQRHVQKLREEFQKTGDTSLLKDINKGERDIKRLAGWMKTFSQESEKTGNALTRVTSLAGGFANPVTAGVAGVTAAFLALPAGAAIAGTALAGVGAGFIALGAAGVKNSQRVQAATSALGTTTQRTLGNAASVMEGPFIGALERLRGTVASTEGPLRRMFADTAPHVANLADGVDGFAQNAMPGLQNSVKASGGVLDEIGRKMPELGDAISDALDEISDDDGSRQGAVKAISVAFDALNLIVKNTGNTLGFFSKAWEKWSSAPGAKVVLDWVDGLAGVDSGARSAAASTDRLAISSGVLLEKFKALTDAERESSNRALSLSGTSDAIAASFQRVAEAAKQRGAAIGASNEKSRDMREQIRSSLDLIQREGDLMLRDGANIGQVTARRDADLRKLRDIMVARGHDRAAVEAFIVTALRVPKSVFTKVSLSGAESAKQNLISVGRAAQSIERAYTLTVGIRGTSAAYATLNQLSAKARAGVDGHAAGGPIRGPGTGTSDSIPAMLSDGEYVINARSARRIGMSNLNALNRFAGGGPVTAGSVSSARWKQLLAQGWRGRPGDGAERLYPPGSGGGSAAAFPRMSTPQTGKQVWANAEKLAKLVRAAFSGNREGSLLSLITRDSKALASLANQRASVVKKLGAAQKRLADLTKARNDTQANIADKVRGSFSLLGDDTSADAVINRLGSSVANARSFGDRISALKRMGLSSGLIQMLAEAGPDGGNAAALGLVRAGGGQIQQINHLFGQLNNTANSTGSIVASALYGSGVGAAQALVKGLQSQQKAIDAQMARIANSLTAALRGAITHRASGGPVRAGEPYIVGERRPELFIPNQSGRIAPRVPGAGGGINIEKVIIQVAPGANGRDIGRQFVEYVRQFEKAGGKTWAPA